MGKVTVAAQSHNPQLAHHFNFKLAFTFGLVDDLFLSSLAPNAATPGFVDVFRREGMSEEREAKSSEGSKVRLGF